MTTNKKGVLMIVSGPAGVGKGTVVAKSVEESNGNIYLSISATTRAPRPIDAEGVTYFFKSKDEFERMIENNELLEWASYVDNYYGTPKKPVMDALEAGKDVILEIEVQGALKVKENFSDAVLTFIVPPSISELENRLRGRNTETEEQIQKRLAAAKNEFSVIGKYDYVVQNNTVEDAVKDIFAILRSEKLKRENFENNLY